jgi:hypothetical protein
LDERAGYLSEGLGTGVVPPDMGMRVQAKTSLRPAEMLARVPLTCWRC